jgi:hypothetical protein
MQMRTMVQVLMTLSVILTAPRVWAESSAQEIMEHALKAVKLSGAESMATLQVFDEKGEARTMKMASISKIDEGGATEKRLIQFVAPADIKEMAFLSVDHEKASDEIWVYLPAIRRVRRLLGGQKAKNFMGSEFSYADMSPPQISDFKHKLLRTEKVNGILCWVIESTPNSKNVAEENGFSRRVTSIEQSTYVIRKAVYFDHKNQLQKELNVTEVKGVLDHSAKRYQMARMEMTNKQNNRRSVLQVDKLQIRTDVPDNYFARFLNRQ